MKTYFAALVVSLALNVAFAALIARAPSDNQNPESSRLSPSHSSPSNAAATAVRNHREPLWSAGGAKDVDTLFARLQSAGCSPREIALILSTVFINRMAQPDLEHYRSATYWSNPPRRGREWELASTAIWLESQQLRSKYLLRPEIFAANEEFLEQMRRQYGDLPVEKLRQLALIDSNSYEANLRLQLTQMRSAQPGEPRFNPDAAAMKQLLEQKESAIRLALTPAEYELYELHSSPTAYRLRSQLAPFRPTESEYRALFAIEKAQSESPLTNGEISPAAREAFGNERKTQITAALGPERAAQYFELQKNGSELPRLMARLDLPLTTISSIDRIRQDTYEAATAVRENSRLSAAERDAQLATLARKAETDLTATLGARGYAAYAELKGDWLRSLGRVDQSKSESP